MAKTVSQRIRVYVIEEQEMYQEVYQSVFPATSPVKLVGLATDKMLEVVRPTLSLVCPEVLLVSVKRLTPYVTRELEELLKERPKLGLVLLLQSCDAQDVTTVSLLRRLAFCGEGGLAILLKESIDQAKQLRHIILLARQGKAILDPSLAIFLMEELTLRHGQIKAEEVPPAPVRGTSPPRPPETMRFRLVCPPPEGFDFSALESATCRPHLPRSPGIHLEAVEVVNLPGTPLGVASPSIRYRVTSGGS